MKRTRKQAQDRQPRQDGTVRGLAEAELAQVAGGDTYMQNPRGSNSGSSGSGG
jgi:hypothetical protein